MQVDLEEAAPNLPSLVERAVGGEEVILSRNGRPAVRLVSILGDAALPRQPGLAKGLVWASPDCHEPMTDDEVEEFLGK